MVWQFDNYKNKLYKEKRLMNLDEAKELFLSSNCSKFDLGRENPSAYKRYKELNIEKKQENKWREEQLVKYFEDIKKGNKNQKHWITFNKMYDLVDSARTKNNLSVMSKAALIINNNLNEKEKVIIAEIIIGRKARSCRSGLIYLSYDLGDKKSASLFALMALELLENNFLESSLRARAKNMYTFCESIMEELSINRITYG